MRTLTVSFGLLALGFAVPVLAATPPEIVNFQGVLRDNTGQPLNDDDLDMLFRFYDGDGGPSCIGGTLLFTDAHLTPDGVAVTGGLFNVPLGSGDPIPGSENNLAEVFRDNATVFLEVRVGLETLCPRIELASAPYSLNADHLDGEDSTFFLDGSTTPQEKPGQLTLSGGVDLGAGTDDDLNAADVTMLTGGGVADALHVHASAGNSDTLDGLDSSQFLRSDADTTFDGGTLRIQTGSRIVAYDDGLHVRDIIDDDPSSGGPWELDPDARSRMNQLELMSSLDFRWHEYDIVQPEKWRIRGFFTGSGLDFAYNDAVDETSILRLEPSGKLGLGTTNPQQDVHIRAISPVVRLQSTQAQTLASSHIEFGSTESGIFEKAGSIGNSGSNNFLDLHSPNAISFNVNFAERMRIAGTGNVGIGTSIPGKELDVAGDIRATGSIESTSGGFSSVTIDDSLTLQNAYFGGEVTVDCIDDCYIETPSRKFDMHVDSGNQFTQSLFTWTTSTGPLGQRSLMLLLGDTSPAGDGDLVIRGQLLQNGFDLAESYYRTEPVEPGDLVKATRDRPDGVGLTRHAGDAAVVGVVSTDPGVVLGGAALDVEVLRSHWGDEVVEQFEALRARLESELTAPGGVLHEEHERLTTIADATDIDRNSEEFRELQERFDSRKELLALRRFVASSMVDVAMSGRVPVKVNTQNGAVELGDLLTPSDTPGVAMKAMAPGPVIGTALEGFSGPQGKIMALVHRGYYTPADRANYPKPGAIKTELDAEQQRLVPDPATGFQYVQGHLQIMLDAGSDDQARFSVFRDGQNDLQNEVFRVDEQGNVFSRGAFRPASMDLAEYLRVSESVEAGDVLVLDTEEPGFVRRSRIGADRAVMGIVSAEPGVVLGSGITRLTHADPQMAKDLERARELGDRDAEARLWQELQQKFEATHAPIALSGTVLCKVDAGYGAIRVGDLLTTSPTPGHAMRSDDPSAGTIIGKAIEPLESGVGKITVMVMLR